MPIKIKSTFLFNCEQNVCVSNDHDDYFDHVQYTDGENK